MHAKKSWFFSNLFLCIENIDWKNIDVYMTVLKNGPVIVLHILFYIFFFIVEKNNAYYKLIAQFPLYLIA